jgi:hypothetical protein
LRHRRHVEIPFPEPERLNGLSQRDRSFVGLTSMFLDPDQAAFGASAMLCFNTVKTMAWLASDFQGLVFQHYCNGGLAEIFYTPWLLSTRQQCCPWSTLCLLDVIPGASSKDMSTQILVPTDKTLGSILVPDTPTIASTVHRPPKEHITTSFNTPVRMQIKLRTRTL